MTGLFHYTTNNGAFGIIDSSELFATHFRYLNDAQELLLAKEILVPIFEAEFREEASRLINEGSLRPNFLREHGTQVHRGEAEKLFEIALRTTDQLSPIFLTSFCRHSPETEEYNDDLLSQCQGYGSAGGCAIEFDEEELRNCIREEGEKHAYSHISLEEVLYEEHERALNLPDIEGVARAVLRHLLHRSEETEAIYNQSISHLYKTVAAIAPTLKSRGFREEREVRIIAPCLRKRAATDLPQRTRKWIFERYKAGFPIPYIKLFNDLNKKIPIKSIVVGPQTMQDKVAYALEIALEQRKINGRLMLILFFLI